MTFLKRVQLSWVLSAIIAVGVLVNLVLTNRPPSGYSMLQIEEIAELPDTPELADVRRYAEIGSGFIPHLRWSRSDIDMHDQPVKVGWVYKENGMLGLPYWASDVSTGPSLFIDTGEGYQIAGIAPGQIGLLEQKVGRPFLRDYRFQAWRHMWGWLFPLSLLLLILLWRRESRRREEAEWARMNSESEEAAAAE